MQALDPLRLPLAGRLLLEASAGTGKTWTLSLLVLRLVVEQALDIDHILVLTYTRAATAELKSRIRARLRQAQRFWQSGQDAAAAGLDAETAQVLNQILAQGPPGAGQRLDAAVSRMDEAAITTIHGFCQKVLQEQAFEAGLPFDQDLLVDESGLREEFMADFWRSRFYPLGPEESAMVASWWDGPQALLRELERSLAVADADIRPPLAPDARERSLTAVRESHASVAAKWQKQGGEVRAFLAGNKALSRAHDCYRQDNVARLVADMEALAANNDFPRLLPERLKLLDAGFMHRHLRKNHDPDWQAPPFCKDFAVFWQAYQELMRTWRLGWLLAARHDLKDGLARKKQEQRRFGYDDLLIRVEQALRQPALAAALGERFPAVLVDEFQDTDPVQYRIFTAIGSTPGHQFFCMIGDPKQAIYSFRGGDIFTYLRAKQDTEKSVAGACRTMNTNYRSAPGAIALVNTLFGRKERPFGFSGMDFYPVEPAGRAQDADLQVQGTAFLPLNLLLLPNAGQKALTKTEAAVAAAQRCAALIRRLLAPGRVCIKNRPLASGDIAVLVQNHRQAEQMKAALMAEGLASVYALKQSVFTSPEAEELSTLLAALMDPADRALAVAAFATSLFGSTARELYAARQQSALADEGARKLHEYRIRWQQYGVGPMLYRLFAQEKLSARLGSPAKGERRLTNFLHLAELLHEAERAAPGMERLLRWLGQERQEAGNSESQDERLMRLESDEHLVRISTWHSAKGLEYPVVFLPFLWDARGRTRADATLSALFHDRKTLRASLSFHATSAEQDLAQEEEDSEQMRLLYVALTRAIYCTFACWGRISDMEQTAMARLLHQDREFGDDSALMTDCNRLNATEAGQLVRCIRPEKALLAEGAGANEISTEAAPLAARPFTGVIGLGYLNCSYSGMVAGLDALAAGDRDEVPLPETSPGPEAQDFIHIDTFPRGPQAGSCLHSLLEQLDFTRPAAAQAELLGQVLERFGVDPRWAGALPGWLDGVLATHLPDSRTLAGLPPQDSWRELKFWFPVQAYPRLCTALGLPHMGGRHAQGLMTGAMDLVFRHEGRFYIVDYKSNHLGGQTAYTDAAMQASMTQHQYQVQYRIYTLALHRLLRSRLAGYAYERDFGGVYYLFVRGMRPGSGQGIFHVRPEIGDIARLDALCGEAGHERR